MPYDTIRTIVERTWGRTPATPRDFNQLSESILLTTHQHVSVSTLKRLWGYVKSPHEPRRDVLDILASYCGYASWSAFSMTVEQGNLPPESNLVMGECIKGEEVPTGRLLRVIWRPQSACTFRSLGQGRFEVMESFGSKLPIGATFVCRQFIQGEPLYLTDLRMTPDMSPASYVCGRDAGVKIL